MSDAFWSARPVLQHVLTLARARGVGPWAVLGTAMARAVCTIPPTVALPGIVGGRMSLNLFVAAVGPSGGGKGAADAAALDGFTFTGPAAQLVPLGSGEGIARTFRPLGTKRDEPNPVPQRSSPRPRSTPSSQSTPARVPRSPQSFERSTAAKPSASATPAVIPATSSPPAPTEPARSSVSSPCDQSP